MAGGFVDCHTHMVPSGDDGVRSVEEGAALCRAAAARGTAVLFATPHVSPTVPLTPERASAVRRAADEIRTRAGLDYRLGYELTPMEGLLDDDLTRYAVEGTDLVLIEIPFVGSADLVVAVAERAEEQGLSPVIAHPERTEAVEQDPGLARALAERGWPLQINATSLTGYHGPEIEQLAWALLEDGTATVVASDGHRAARPPFLDRAFALAQARLGERAVSLFDGSGLGFPATAGRPPSPAGSRAA